MKNRPRREPRTRSTRGHAPRGLRAVAELFALDELFAAIAREKLGIATLETQRSDSLDFHDVAVWSVKAALEAAYRAGLAAAKEER